METKKTRENLLTENWYFVQGFGNETKDLHCECVICFAKNIIKAKQIIKKWETKNNCSVPDSGMYLKNYKRQAKIFVDAGNYIA